MIATHHHQRTKNSIAKDKQNLSRVIGSFAKINSASLCDIIKASIFLLTFLFLGSAHANNILVSNSKVVAKDGITAFIEFNLSWDNSWRVADLGHGVGNWDAAWVFVKFREAGGSWKHTWLSTNNSHHSTGTGTEATLSIGATTISGSTRGMGAFIYRSGNGSGTFSVSNVRLQWNNAEQGVNTSSTVEIRVFAIEMVYVAEGTFAVGGLGTESGRLTLTTINTAVVTTVPSGIGSLGGEAGGYPTGQTAPNAAWPNGFAAFYMMKYEISQQQYVDFLNTISRAQQPARFVSMNVGTYMHNTIRYTPVNRCGVRNMSDPGGTAARVFGCDLNNNGIAGEADDGRWIAMNWIGWSDGLAYMDWSGLRPMTDLEFEKAARGMAAPVANENAWGTAGSTAVTGFNNAQLNDETAIPESANFRSGDPIRVGAFAKAGTSRVQSGASYWGIMELTGNVLERAVSVSVDSGRNFTGLHGDGELSSTGNYNVTSWPDPDGGIFRGFQVAYRIQQSNTHVRWIDRGFRGVRSAP